MHIIFLFEEVQKHLNVRKTSVVLSAVLSCLFNFYCCNNIKLRFSLTANNHNALFKVGVVASECQLAAEVITHPLTPMAPSPRCSKGRRTACHLTSAQWRRKPIGIC